MDNIDRDIELKFFDSRNDTGLRELYNSNEVFFTHDIYSHCLDELFDIEHPSIKPADHAHEESKRLFLSKYEAKGNFDDQGVWVYYPWSRVVVHVPEEEIFIKLRTSRNRDLITTAEQELLAAKCIAIAGMSVGSNILNAILLTSCARNLKIADPDVISLPNLNRLIAPISAIGQSKVVYFARHALEMDPFLKIDIYRNGLNVDGLDQFFSNPVPDLFFEEMDNIHLKILSRQYAREKHIPVIMVTDNADGVFVDVERYDNHPKPPLLNGRLKQKQIESIRPEIPFMEKVTLAARVAGLTEAAPRMQLSITKVGRTLNTWPQLGTAAMLAGVTGAYVGRQILLGEKIKSKRYRILPDATFITGYGHVVKRVNRRIFTAKILLGLKRMMQRAQRE